MTRRQRIVLLLIAAVVLVAGIAVATSSGGDDGSETAGTTTATPDQANPVGGETETTPPAETQEAPPPPRVETIRMRGRAPVGEAKTLRYERGDTIRLRFTSDVAEEVHIHGFDEYVQVPAGGTPKTARFKANLEGIFEVEAHSTGEVLAKLEIRPG